MIHPGLASVTFRSWPPERVLAAAARCKLTGIEWAGDVHVPPGDLAQATKIAALTQRHRLSVVSYGSYFRADGSAASRDLLPRVLDTACALGAPSIRVWAGTVGSHRASPRQRRQIVNALRHACARASLRGLKLALEFHADTLNDSATSSNKLLQEVNHPALSTYWQPPVGTDFDRILSELRQLAPRISNLHIFHWASASQRRPLVTGSHRWRAYLKAIHRTPGKHYALLEFLPLETETDLHRDSAILHKILQEEFPAPSLQS